jgi:hypothetical protein
MNKKRKSQVGAQQNANLATLTESPEYQEDIKFDHDKFHDLNNKYGPFQIELFASSTNNILPNHYTKESDAYSDEWSRRSFYGNPILKKR